MHPYQCAECGRWYEGAAYSVDINARTFNVYEGWRYLGPSFCTAEHRDAWLRDMTKEDSR